MNYGQVRGSAEDLSAFAEITSAKPTKTSGLPERISLDPEKVEKGLSQLVLSILELVRQLIHKQALRRIEGGSLSEDQVEKLGVTLMRLETQMEELKRHFDVDYLNLDLGPLGKLLDE
jgi:uncharacterized protein YgbK (DUF1537 family)